MPSSDLDAFDHKILAALQRNGRLSNVDLAEEVGLSPSPCLRRVKRLEQDGYIRGYRAVLDRRKVGLGLTVYVDIKVEKHSTENAAMHQRLLEAIPEVVAAHMVSGEADFVAEVVVPDLAAYETLLTERLLSLPMVKDVRSNFVIRQVKTDAALPLSHLAPE
ncbi:Lrp/AsnC family transcriptional regulator [Ferrovibrio sp.]|jgi:Lrp/AsnC family leucine-responsive transcriptional regulator|uniref:Lrp/AsnC family transcriptional regulator n=1 Tax=Ferrovibrio sp. TaxID=1917215 RepID=UPI0035ADD232